MAQHAEQGRGAGGLGCQAARLSTLFLLWEPVQQATSQVLLLLHPVPVNTGCHSSSTPLWHPETTPCRRFTRLGRGRYVLTCTLVPELQLVRDGCLPGPSGTAACGCAPACATQSRQAACTLLCRACVLHWSVTAVGMERRGSAPCSAACPWCWSVGARWREPRLLAIVGWGLRGHLQAIHSTHCSLTTGSGTAVYM